MIFLNVVILCGVSMFLNVLLRYAVKGAHKVGNDAIKLLGQASFTAVLNTFYVFS